MTENRWRLPIGGRMLALARADEPTNATDLFDAPSSGAVEPHPDFAERAEIWRLHREGIISVAEASRRSANVGRAVAARASKSETVSVSRHSRPAPNDSRQYSGTMSTTAARDDRLVPQAKALLTILRARAGKGRSTTTTKTTLAAILSRSTRSIARYLRELEAFGYVTTTIRTTGRGLHLGLVVTITQKALPFFEQAGALAAWLAEAPEALARPFVGRVLSGKAGMTGLSSKNQPTKISILQDIRNRFGKATRATASPN